MDIHCRHDRMVPVAELRPHPKNRNKHPEKQIVRLAKLIEYNGCRAPVVVSNLSGFIVKGHGTLQALIKAGMTEAPVVYQDFDSDSHEYSFLQSDNAIAEWAELDFSGINADLGDLGPDFDLDLLGLDGFQLESKKPTADQEAIPERIPARAKLGDLYQLGRHRLMCGNATSMPEVERLLGGQSIDAVYTDPPYGMNVVKSSGKLHGEGLPGLCASGVYAPVIGDDSTQTAHDAYRLCASLEIPVMVFWGGNFYAEHLPPSSGWICWDKENGEGFFADGELAWTNQPKQLRIFKHKWAGMIKESERGEKRVHPTQKPIALAEWTLENYAKQSRAVLDLFGGSGSTLIACENTDRACFMMELSPDYVDVIVARWEKISGQKASLISSDADNNP